MAELEDYYNHTEIDRTCDPNLNWWIFILAVASIYLFGLVISFFLSLLMGKDSDAGVAVGLRESFMRTRKVFSRLLSKETIPGKILAVCSLICNGGYLGLALYYTTLPVKRCVDNRAPTVMVELSLSAILLVLFVLRLFAAQSPLQHWIRLHTIVDVLTLPHVFLVLILGKDWLGLRTLRFLWLTEGVQLVNVFPCCHFSQDVLSVIRLVLRLIGMWLAVAGLIQLLEASGDPWDEYGIVQNLTFLESAYFVMVTMSTVGYGDIYAITVWGRAFITLFILTGLAVYATALPTLVDVALVYYTTHQFNKDYCSDKISQFVVVCGRVTAESVEGFLKELLHPDRHDKSTHIVFLHTSVPSTELRRVLKNYFTRVDYIMGSPLSTKDLQRCLLQRAKACVVLADRFSNNPLAEDRANLLRVVSVKNTVKHVPVILQLLCSSSKELLHSIPGWSSRRDVVLCLNELRLRILAQACLTPGFSTLISNLFFASSLTQLPKQSSHWKTLYMKGACKEIYSVKLSASFEGMTVGEAAQLCFREMGLILTFVVEDATVQVRGLIQEDAVGYFIADKAHDVEKAGLFCWRCHIGDWKRSVTQCYCTAQQMKASRPSSITPHNASPFHHYSVVDNRKRDSPPQNQSTQVVNELTGHIVLCVFAASESTAIGLESFIFPLYSQYTIVIVCDTAYLNKELTLAASFPQLYIVSGSPLDWNCLMQARIRSCHMCVIVTVPSKESEQGTGDKEAVLCSLLLQHRLKEKVVVLTDLFSEQHIHLLDTSSHSEQPAFLADPFAYGNAFLSSVFDTMTVVAFHSVGTIVLLECLLASSHHQRNDQSPGCGAVIQLPLSSPLLARYAGHCFSSLFDELAAKGLICIGIYRQLRENCPTRYIITAPEPELSLQFNDVTLVIQCT